MNKNTKKIVISSITLIEIVLFSDVIYGFNALIPIYKNLGVFMNKNCTNNLTLFNDSLVPFCENKSRYYSDSVIVWVVAQALLAPLVGMYLDHFGIQSTLIFGAFLSAFGSFLFSITQFYPYLLFVAGCLISNSATFVGMGCIQLSHILRGNRNFLISLQTGLMSSSSLVYLVIKKLYDIWKIPIYVSFNILGSSAILIIVTTSVTLIKRTAHETLKRRIYEVSSSEEDDILSKFRRQRINYLNDKYPTMQASITSLKYWSTSIFYFSISYRYVFVVSQFSHQVKALFIDPNIIDSLVDVSSILLSLGIVSSLSTGILIDFLAKRAVQKIAIKSAESKEDIDKNQRMLDQILVKPFLFCAFLNLLGSLLINLSNYHTLCIGILMFCFSRWMASCLLSSSISSLFPIHHFGELIGVTIFGAGMLACTMIPIVPFASPDKSPFLINNIFIICPLVAMMHPLVLYFF